MSAAAITADPTAVKRNPQDILGLQFSQYKQKVYSLSVTNPTEYFATREKMEEILKRVLVTNMYDVIYNLLRYGIINDNGTEKQVCVSSASPFYPSNMVNDEAIKISATLNSIIDDIINIIHPSDYEALALDKMRLKAKAVGL